MKVVGTLVYITGVNKWHIDPWPDGGDDLIPLTLTTEQSNDAWDLLNLGITVDLNDKNEPKGIPWCKVNN